jgi:hypothetical protein
MRTKLDDPFAVKKSTHIATAPTTCHKSIWACKSISHAAANSERFLNTFFFFFFRCEATGTASLGATPKLLYRDDLPLLQFTGYADVVSYSAFERPTFDFEVQSFEQDSTSGCTYSSLTMTSSPTKRSSIRRSAIAKAMSAASGLARTAGCIGARRSIRCSMVHGCRRLGLGTARVGI